MAYPAEHEVDAYRRYLIRYSIGEEGGKRLSPEEFRERRKKKKTETVLES